MKEALAQLLVNLANLFKVKTILSLIVVVTTCVLTIKGIIDVVAFMSMATAIVTYYFTRKDDNKEEWGVIYGKRNNTNKRNGRRTF